MNHREKLARLETRAAQEAAFFLSTLDHTLGIYIHPNGQIAIHGIIDERVVYRTFKDY
jgi:hypothetical protein